ncbi:hypothetical protein ACOSP7_004502 [Xanthoceras sorbifolium]
MDCNMIFSGVLADELLLREIWHDGPRDEMRFRLGQHTVRFSRVKFCLITGLKFGHIPDMSAYVDVLQGIHSKCFGRRTDVKVKDVKNRLEQGDYVIPQDALKLSLILMLHNFLYGSDEGSSTRRGLGCVQCIPLGVVPILKFNIIVYVSPKWPWQRLQEKAS